ncbi:MAG TPA: hypothetical protein VG838_12705 [Opitutaceae bacterium]|nr:hypothetical protein [Opitutaceae bacterium]
MSDSTPSPSRGPVQSLIAVCFALLSVGFFFRFLQAGFKRMRHVVEGDANFKALAIWALIYAVVCAAIAAVVFRLPREPDTSAQNGERGT